MIGNEEIISRPGNILHGNVLGIIGLKQTLGLCMSNYNSNIITKCKSRGKS